VTEIEDWLRGQPLRPVPPARPQPVASAARTTSNAVPPASSPPRARAAAAPEPSLPQPVTARAAVAGSVVPVPEKRVSKPRSPVPLALGAGVILVVSWAGMQALRTHSARDAALQTSSVAAPAAAVTPVPAPPAALPPVPAPSVSTTTPAQVEAAPVPAAVHEEIPDVPRRARQTIHGHVRVSVRVIVDAEGKVLAARADNPGPSRYFERIAIEAAKKWTFPPVDSHARRLESVRFEFTRQGAKAHAVSLK
jgi:TonB family protein